MLCKQIQLVPNSAVFREDFGLESMSKLEKSREKRKKPEREARTAAAASIRDARRALGISKKELAQLAVRVGARSISPA
jgi:ribosome-binding protein aMBF1 (putative translation factor)